MSTPNPYFNEDADDDILGDTNSSSNSNPNRPSFGGGPHFNGKVEIVMIGPDGKPLPGSVSSSISDFLSDMIGLDPADKMPYLLRFATDITQYFHSIQRSRPFSPMMLAMADILDDMTGGRYRKLHRFYELEAHISYTHFLKRVVNLLVTNANENDQGQAEIKLYFGVLAEISDHTQQKAIAEYKELCVEIEREPDEGVLLAGYPTVDNPYEAAISGIYAKEFNQHTERFLEKSNSTTETEETTEETSETDVKEKL